MDYSGIQVMVVDDNPINLKVIEETLRPLGVAITLVKSGKECIESIKDIDPAIFILDIMMPEMDGFELYGHIREIKKFSLTPIVFISALNDIESEGKGIELGAVDFITKPINPGLVRSRIENHLKLQIYQNSLAARAQLKEEQFKELFFNSPIAQLLVSYPALKIKEANIAAEKLLGYTIEEICSMTPLDISTSTQKEGIPTFEYGNSCYKRSLNGELDSFEWIHLSKDKKELICEIRVMPFPGEEEIFIASIVDITERKKAEERIIKANRYVKGIMDSMPFAVIGVTNDLNISLWNSSVSDLTGINSSAAIDKNIFEIIPYLKLERESIEYTIANREVQKVEKRERVSKNGTIVENIVIYPLDDEEEGAVILIDNITEDVNLKNKVIQSEKMMPVSDMIAGIIHEVTNPLAGVIQNSQSMEKRLGSSIPANIKCAEEYGLDLESLKGYLRDRKIFDMLLSIRESGKKATQIVKNLQSFIRDDSGSQVNCNMLSIVDQALELAESDFNILNKVDFKTIDRNIELDNLPEVKCDSTKILQVFTNIFMFCERNISLSGKGGRVDIEGLVEDKYLTIIVKDNGLQISSDDLEIVKKPSYDNRKRGYWYYLSMANFIVEEVHGGRFSVTSSAFGNECRVSLPL